MLMTLRAPDRAFPPPRAPRGSLAAAAAALFAALPAHAALTGTLHPGLGYDIVTGTDGNPQPVGFVSPTLSYVLPNSSTGGSTAGRGVGIGSAQYSAGAFFTRYRGVVA